MPIFYLMPNLPADLQVESNLFMSHSFFVDPCNQARWEIYQTLGLPCPATAGEIGGSPQFILEPFANSYPTHLPVLLNHTVREVVMHPEILAGMSRGLINQHFLNGAQEADEILALVKKAENQLVKLHNYKPVDGISGPCPLGFGPGGGYVEWMEQDASPTFGDPEMPDFERRFTASVRDRAISLFAWHLSHWVRTTEWKPEPPQEVWINACGKQRRVFHFRIPLDKVILNTLSLVLQAAVASPPNSHGWVVGRGVRTAAEQITKFVSDGFVWVQTLDIRNAFPSMSRAKTKKCLRARFKLMSKKLKQFDPHKPDLATRLAESWKFIESTIDIDHAVSANGKGLIDVSDVGLVQGSSVAPVYFNLCMERMDRKFLGGEGEEVVLVRYGDNIFVLAKSKAALNKGVARIRSYCGQFGCKIKCEVPPSDIWKSKNPIQFLGLEFTISKHGSAIAALSSKAVAGFAKIISAMPSHRRRRRALRALFWHYAPGGYLTEKVLKDLAGRLTAALLRKAAPAKMDIGYCKVSSLMALRDDILKKQKMASHEDEDWDPDDEMYIFS